MPMVIAGSPYTDKELAGKAILAACQQMKSPVPVNLGSYRGFSMELSFDEINKTFKIVLKSGLRYRVTLGDDAFGNITRLNNAVASLPKMLGDARENLEDLRNQLKNAQDETRKPFAQETELKLKSGRLAMGKDWNDYLLQWRQVAEECSGYLTTTLCGMPCEKEAARIHYLDDRGHMVSSQNINDLRLARKEIGAASADHTLYRAVLSVDKQTAQQYDLYNRETWQSLVNTKISVIQREMRIKPDNFRWVASML